MDGARQRADHTNLTVQLFPDLADQRGFGGFVGFNLASRKLPFAGLMFVIGSLRDQHATVALDDGRDHRQGKGIPVHRPLFPASIGAAIE